MNIKIVHLAVIVYLVVFLAQAAVASWMQISGPGCRQISSLLVNDNSVFAGTNGSGVFRTDNYDTNWTAVNEGIKNYSINCLAASSNNIFAGTYSGVFLSTNKGLNWTEVNSGLADLRVRCLAVSGENLFAGTDDGVFLSANKGSSWIQIKNGLPNLYCFVMCLAVSDGHIFAGIFTKGIYHSADTGKTWTYVNYCPVYVNSFAVDDSGTIFAGTSNRGIYRFTDSDTSWIPVNNGLKDTSILSLGINKSGNIFAGTSNRGIYRSTDNGTSWAAVNNGLKDTTSILSLVIDDSGNIFAGTDRGGAFLSTDNGESWKELDFGFPSFKARTLAVSGSKIFAGTDSAGIFLSKDNGTSWTSVNHTMTDRIVYSLAINGGNIFAGTDFSFIYRSTDSGMNWTGVRYSDKWESDVYSVFVSNNAIVFAGTGGNGVYKSTDSGKSWFAANNGIRSGLFNAFANCKGNLFAGSRYTGGDPSNVVISNNEGISWKLQNIPLPYNDGVFSFAVIGDNIFAGTASHGVFIYNNIISTWKPVDTNSSGFSDCLAVSGKNLFASGYSEMNLSTNNGADWTRINATQPGPGGGFITVNDSSIFAISGGSIWRRPLSEIVGVIDDKPRQRILKQTFLKIKPPNHSNPKVTIEFSLPHSTLVCLKVYNLSGREMATVVDKYLGSGSHALAWDTRYISAGCYFATIQAGPNSYAKSILISR